VRIQSESPSYSLILILLSIVCSTRVVCRWSDAQIVVVF